MVIEPLLKWMISSFFHILQKFSRSQRQSDKLLLTCNIFAPFCILQSFIQVDDRQVTPSGLQEEMVAEGFGKLYPSAQAPQQQMENSDDEQDLVSDVISRKELDKGRLSKDGKYDQMGSSHTVVPEQLCTGLVINWNVKTEKEETEERRLESLKNYLSSTNSF